MKFIKERVFNSDVFVMTLEKDEVPVLVAGDYKQVMTVKEADNKEILKNGYKKIGAVNCGFFNMSTREMLGQCKDNVGIKQSETGWEDGYADIAFDGSNIVVGDIATFGSYKWVRTLSWGIFKDGKEWNLGTNKYSHDTTYQPRTMIGSTMSNETILIVVDGRGTKSKLVSGLTNKGVTYSQQVEIAKRYNCKNLVNADGGASSVMEYNGDIVNTPSDGSLRKCTDFVVVYKKYDNEKPTGDGVVTNEKMIKIALDAGHGYNTAGKRTPDDIREWYLNNNICNYIDKKLSGYKNVEIYRTDDTTGKTDISLSERVARCNKYNPDVFLSIHHNATGSTWVTSEIGTEVYWHTYGTQEDKKLASIIAPKLSSHTGLKNRGVKQASFSVLGCKSTAVLIEGGFMNSRVDHAIITTWGQEAYADAIVESLVEYLKLEKKEVVIPQPEPLPPVEEKPTESVQVNENGETLYYRVCAGSYTLKSKAQEQQDKLKQQGIDSFLVATWIK